MTHSRKMSSDLQVNTHVYKHIHVLVHTHIHTETIRQIDRHTHIQINKCNLKFKKISKGHRPGSLLWDVMVAEELPFFLLYGKELSSPVVKGTHGYQCNTTSEAVCTPTRLKGRV